MLKWRFRKQLYKVNRPTENRHSDSLKKSQLSLSQGMMKNGDIIILADDYDDDEVRTNASQNYVTARLCTEEFFHKTQYI